MALIGAIPGMMIDGKRVRLSPGMNITAEIKTGQRRVIEYLLSPVQRAGSESLRERQEETTCKLKLTEHRNSAGAKWIGETY